MQSNGFAQPLSFDLNYKVLDVLEDESPNMIIYHTVAITSKQNDFFIKIDGIRYDVEINEIIKSNGNENQIIKLNNINSDQISFFSGKELQKDQY
jgi:LEA14-like dessication related protein